MVWCFDSVIVVVEKLLKQTNKKSENTILLEFTNLHTQSTDKRERDWVIF